jgi:hypothetical protein
MILQYDLEKKVRLNPTPWTYPQFVMILPVV